jgi:hypothetical protein
MTVVTLKVSAGLDWSMLALLLPLLLGAAMLMLLAGIGATAQSTPRAAMVLMPATLLPAPPAMQFHRRQIPRACSASRAPPDLPQPELAIRIPRLVARR